MTRIIPSLNLAKSLPKATDVLLVGLATINQDNTVLVGVPGDVDKAYQKANSLSLLQVAESLGATSAADSVTFLPPLNGLKIVVVGVEDADVTPERLRRSAGAALRAIQGRAAGKTQQISLSLDVTDPELLQAAAEGAVLGAYQVQRITADPAEPGIVSITLLSPVVDSPQKQAIATAEATAAAVCLARDWGNTPPNLLYPESFAEQAKAAVREERIAVEILDEKALERGGYGGLLAVGGGSVRKPRLIRLNYRPRGARAHLALVGKGITFDSGGLDIKPAGQMAGMKFDMSGAGAVLAATRAIAQLGLKVEVTAYAALAENLPSGSSYRSSDVLTMFNGMTVENYNTDAEGRLVLADAIARAATDEPDLIVDIATLTGACMVGLGMRTAGLLTNGEETAELVLDAAESAGEEFWELPLTDHTRSLIKSQVADMRSGSGQRWGGALVAGAFLERFVPENTAWAHLDIAGPAENPEEPYGYVPRGGTGMGVRTLIALATELANRGR